MLYSKEYYLINREAICARVNKYRLKNKEKVAAGKKDYTARNKEKVAALRRDYHLKNKEEICAKSRKWYSENKEKSAAYDKDRYFKNKEKYAVRNKMYRFKNKKQIATHIKKRKETDINYRLSCLLRSRLSDAIRNNQKTGSAVRDLGCTIPELKFYLEGQFQDGMTWGNWSRTGWHIDHKIPLDFFDLTDREQLLQAVHYTNLQPMWAKENITKKAKLPPGMVKRIKD